MMIDYNKIKKQLAEIFNEASKAEKEEKEEQEEVLTRQVDKKTANAKAEKVEASDQLPTVDVILPEKPEIELPVYEKIEYTPKTDEEIEKEVTDYLSEYKSTALEGFDKNFENTKALKEQEKETEKAKKEQSIKNLDHEYESKKKDVTNDMIKRGMSYSSTSSLMQEKNDKDKIFETQQISQEYADAIKELDNAIAKAEAQRQQAISEFNVTYALKFADRVKSLKDQRQSAIDNAIKQNNEIAEQEFKDVIQKEKTESKLYGEALDHYQTEKEIQDEAQKELADSYDYRIYTILRKQLAGMSKQDAYNAIRNDPTYVENLTTNYYLQLVDEFGR